MWPYLKLCYCRYYLSYMDKWDGVSRWSSVNSVLMKQEAGHRGKGRNRNPWKQRWRCTLHCHQTGNLKLKGSGKDGSCRWPDLNSHPAGICTSAHLFSIPSADLCYHGVGKVTQTPKRMVTPMADMQGVVIAISSPRLIQPLSTMSHANLLHKPELSSFPVSDGCAVAVRREVPEWQLGQPWWSVATWEGSGEFPPVLWP